MKKIPLTTLLNLNFKNELAQRVKLCNQIRVYVHNIVRSRELRGKEDNTPGRQGGRPAALDAWTAS